MGQRSMLQTSEMIDLELDQQAQSPLRPVSCVLFGSMTSFRHPLHTILPTAENTANLDFHHLPDSPENALFYGMAQYSGFQHHPARNFDMGVATASNYYNPSMTQSGTRVFPLPLNQGSHNLLPSSSNGRIVGVATDNYIRNDHHFMDGIGVSFKRKNADGIQGSFQYCNASAGSSFSIAPLNTWPIEPGVTMVDAAPFLLPEYLGNDRLPAMEVRSQRTVRNTSDAMGPDSMLAYYPNHLIQANYLGQAFPTANSHWLDQQFRSNGADGGTLSWSLAPAMTYFHGGSNSGGCTEPGTMSAQGYQETASNRTSTNFRHLPHIHLGHPSFHHPSQSMQGMRGQNINFHSQVGTSFHRLSTNSSSYISMNTFQDGVDVGPRYVGHGPPTGLRMSQHHRRPFMPEATVRHHDLPYFRVLPADEVVTLEIPSYYEVGNSIDHHREMRLDIDLMSYE
ncbi:RING-type E3 ubiquitin transferase, partial [Sarracenia purpurea var. burkii]